MELAPGTARVTVQAAASDAVEHLLLDAFLARCRTLFEAGGRVVDQAFQPRVGEGMIRCYLSSDAVVGFGEQFPRLPQSAAVPALGMASAKTMHPATEPRFNRLRRAMEEDWLPKMLGLLGLGAPRLAGRLGRRLPAAAQRRWLRHLRAMRDQRQFRAAFSGHGRGGDRPNSRRVHGGSAGSTRNRRGRTDPIHAQARIVDIK